jgi:hypothetical protein
MEIGTPTPTEETLRAQLRQELAFLYGEMIGGDRLRHVLGFVTSSSLSMAINRKAIDLATFRVNGRRGRFALTKEVADWLVAQRARSNRQGSLPVPQQFQKKPIEEVPLCIPSTSQGA